MECIPVREHGVIFFSVLTHDVVLGPGVAMWGYWTLT